MIIDDEQNHYLFINDKYKNNYNKIVIKSLLRDYAAPLIV